jgi:hypothetical protein
VAREEDFTGFAGGGPRLTVPVELSATITGGFGERVEFDFRVGMHGT